MAKKDLLGHKVYQVASDLLVSVELLELRGRLVQLGTRVHKDFKDHRVPLDLLDHKVHREIMDNQVNKDSLVTQGLQDRVARLGHKVLLDSQVIKGRLAPQVQRDSWVQQDNLDQQAALAVWEVKA